MQKRRQSLTAGAVIGIIATVWLCGDIKVETSKGEKRMSGIVEYQDSEGYCCSGNCIIETETKTLVAGCNNSVIPTDGSVTSIGEFAFYECSELTSITIPNGVTSIGESAFYGCSGLTSITIPDSVTSIGSYAFDGCSGLTSITIPDSVTSIGEDAFRDCSGLTSITVERGNKKYHSSGNCIIETETKTLMAGCINSVIPTDGSVTSIGSYAFRGCRGLKSITIPDGVVSIGEDKSDYCVGLTNIGAFFGCSALTCITIPDSVTSIGAGAFGGCSGLTSITIPDSVTNIGAGAFSLCRALTSITIPDSVTSIGTCAFYGCSGLKNITIPDSVTNIGDRALYDCNNLQYERSGNTKYIGNHLIKAEPSNITEVTIKNCTKTIASGAFYNCSGLTSITIPDSVTSIGEDAFRDCSGLTSITVERGNKKYHSSGNCLIETETKILVKGCNNSVIPTDGSVTSIGEFAFYECSELTSITIPNGVTSIGESAFYGCSGLTSITISDGVTSIGESAFNGCNGLTSIIIPNSVTNIGSGSFYGCSGLTIYAEAAAKPDGWNSYWNSSDRPVVWGYKG